MTRISMEAARAEGLTIDDHVYPPLAYEGPRFNPTFVANCYTELEYKLYQALGQLDAELKAAWDARILPAAAVSGDTMRLVSRTLKEAQE